MSPTARVIYYLKRHRQGSQMFYTPQGNNSGYLWENFPMRLPDWRAKLIAVRVKRSRFASSVSILGFPKDFSILFLYLLLALDSKTKIYQALKKDKKTVFSLFVGSVVIYQTRSSVFDILLPSISGKAVLQFLNMARRHHKGKKTGRRKIKCGFCLIHLIEIVLFLFG